MNVLPVDQFPSGARRRLPRGAIQEGAERRDVAPRDVRRVVCWKLNSEPLRRQLTKEKQA
jgi:hypothetical protein